MLFSVKVSLYKRHTANIWVENAVKMLRMQLPLKAAMTGEDELTSRSCAASAFLRGHSSPDTGQKRSGDTASHLQ